MLALMGDTIDNIKGVPGIGEKGARELIAHVRHARRTCWRTPPRSRTSAIARGCSAHADAARQSRELARIRTDVPVEFDPEALQLPRRDRASAASRSSTSSAFRALVEGVRADRRHHRQGLSHRQHRRRSCAALADGCARPARSRCASLPDGPAPMRAGDRRPGVLDRAARRPTTCRSATAALGDAAESRAARGRRSTRCGRCSRTGDREGRPRPEVRRDRAGAARRRRCAGSSSTRCWRATCSTRRGPAHPLEDLALEHTSYKALTEEDVCGRGAKAVSLADDPGRGGARLRRRARRSGRPARADASRRCSPANSSTEVYATLELPLIPVLVAIERAGVRIDVRGAGRAVAARSSRSWRSGRAQIYELAGGEFNINSPKQLAEVLFDKLQLPVLKRTGTSTRAVDRGRSARGAGARRTTCRA